MSSMPTFAQRLRGGRGLSTFALLTLGFMVLVILWGAVVRATGSGAGCGNHWPLCNGDFLPRHPRLTTLIEFTHRSMSGVCTALVAGLLAWTLMARRKGDPARKAAAVSAFLLLTEALLGAVLVKGGFVESNASDARVVMQCVHFSNTMLLLAALTLTWWFLRTRRSGSGEAPGATAGAVGTPMLAWASLALTLLVGATGSVAALADTLFPSPSLAAALAQDFSAAAPLLIRMRLLHPASVLLAAVAVIALCTRLRPRSARVLLALLGAQIVLGVLDVVLLAPVSLQVLHLLFADVYWIALVAIASMELLPMAPRVPARAALEQRQSVPV